MTHLGEPGLFTLSQDAAKSDAYAKGPQMRVGLVVHPLGQALHFTAKIRIRGDVQDWRESNRYQLKALRALLITVAFIVLTVPGKRACVSE